MQSRESWEKVSPKSCPGAWPRTAETVAIWYQAQNPGQLNSHSKIQTEQDMAEPRRDSTTTKKSLLSKWTRTIYCNYMNEPSLGLGHCLSSSQLSAVSGLTPPPPHITSSHYILATSSGTKQREQVFCLAEPPSSLASSWNIVERGVLGSAPANTWEEACPRCLLCRPSVTLVTLGQVTLESWLLKPFRRADIRPC